LAPIKVEAGIIVDNQYEFRENHSSMALLRMVNNISEELDNKNYSLGLFIDLYKALDMVNHKLLIKNASLWSSVG
jgi:hypothetical protein